MKQSDRHVDSPSDERPAADSALPANPGTGPSSSGRDAGRSRHHRSVRGSGTLFSGIQLNPREFKHRLDRRAKRAGLSVPNELAEALRSYFDLLLVWNKRINLTALDDSDEAFDRLLIEPLVAAKHLPGATCSVLDVGSGGGSPAIPLKLAVPGIQVWMVEAKIRKAAFLREAVRHLSLTRVHVEAARYEELLARPELHEAIDAVTLRAVRVETKVLMNLQAFLKPGGLLLLFRGPAGGDVPGMLMPPLSWQATHPLVESLRSRLVVIRKAAVGPAQIVPRGTPSL